jgi:pullulanase-type alpha-1,6-glucosidase
MHPLRTLHVRPALGGRSRLYAAPRWLTLLLIAALLLTALPAPAALAQEAVATIHYFRPDGEYDGWGLHVWRAAISETPWAEPLEPSGSDDFGVYWEVPVALDAGELGMIIHKGDEKDPGPDMFLDVASSLEAWIISGDLVVYTEQPDPSARPNGDLSRQRAHWLAPDLIAWPGPEDGDLPEGATFSLVDAFQAGMTLTVDGILGSGIERTPLTLDDAGLPDDVLADFPHLEGSYALRLPEEALRGVPGLLKGQLALEVLDADGALLDATGLQIPGVLDALYTWEGPLGLTWKEDVPSLHLWAPTAKRVRLLIFDDAAADEPSESINLKATDGVWSITGDPSWAGKEYLYEVRVFVPATGAIETNLVTDPYSLGLSMNSTRSRIVNLADPALTPEGWESLEKPPLAAPEEITVYELHMRDFSAADEGVPAEHQGGYLAFTHPDSAGMTHLQALADAGLTHLHLLPTFDIATIDEDASTWQAPDPAVLATLPPDSEEQQAAVNETRDLDAFNWGYDPFHFFAPEGSYSSDPTGDARILEYRQMVQAINGLGLRVVNDVVFNHTNAAGQSERSVLDRIVPGYYHRLNADGIVETSTCCSNTATEHAMMERLMLDAVRLWATEYKIDAFRFDLMGHHMVEEMLAVRTMLDGLTLEEDGVDGAAIYLYGEGWDFGEVANNARGVNATQINLAGTGIGTFNDRLRDGVRGVGPFDSEEALRRQGFITGLSVTPNGYDWGSDEAAADRLGLITDWIKVGLAGNLADFLLVDARGYVLRGDEIDYNGAPTGYTADPQENIVYADKHDNQTLFDVVQLAAPAEATVAERAQMAQLGHAIVMLSQGVPFHQAGSDLLRSKSFDRDSYNSGDWFNVIDWTGETTNFGRGLPIADKNEASWPVMQPLLADTELAPSPEIVAETAANFQTLLELRYSSPLFRLQTAEQVMEVLRFLDGGPDAVPGLIAMTLYDGGEGDADLDAENELLVVLFNARPEAVAFNDPFLDSVDLSLSPILADKERYAAADAESVGLSVPARSVAVYSAAELPAEFAERVAAFDAALEEARSEQPSIDEIRAEAEAAEREAAAAAAAAMAADRPAPESVGFPGTIGAALGGADWTPDDPAVAATDQGDGRWTLVATLPAGSYEFKAAINGSWDENYGAGGVAGGDNLPLVLDAESEVTFVYDRATNAVYALVGDEVVAGERP